MLRGSFLRRSLDSLRQNAHNFNLDPEHYSAVLPMVTFPTPESILQNCAIGSDNDTGGYSTASIDHVEEDGVKCLRFKGELSLHVSPEARKRGMTHSGWAGWRTRPMGATLFNRHPVWDTSLFRFLSLRVKGDDRRYYINVQTDSLDPIELWQHRLFLRTPGKWETVLIPWGDFLRTRNGRISYKKFDGMDRERVQTVGASLIERKEGPFCLYIAEIKSVNTHGHQGPMTRYTREDTANFIAEETARSEAETAAYYAWKRGDQPLGTPPPTKPLYQPPDPDTASGQINHQQGHSSPQQSQSQSPVGEDQSRMSESLDDALEERGKKGGSKGIDEVDVDDLSEEGREVRRRAMAEELEGFSVSQRKDAERMEEERMWEGREKGREVRDQFGQRFEEVSTPRRPRK